MAVDAAKDEPVLSRIERLDVMMGYLEELVRGSNKLAKSSCPSTPSSGTVTSEGGNSSVNSSPKSLQKHCRPIDAVMMETQEKGTLVERLVLLENRVLKSEEEINKMVQLSMQMEREMEGKRTDREERRQRENRKKGLKRLIKSCVEGKPKAEN